MRPTAQVWTLPLAALLASACATSGSGSDARPAPVFTRAWRPYTPEERSRDVVGCAEEARSQLTAQADSEPVSAPALRRALFERTVTCMQRRGWKEIGT